MRVGSVVLPSLHCLLSSPSAPFEPQSLLVVNVTSVSITLTWQPPAIPNGVITSYTAWYTETLVCNGSQISNSTRMILPASANVFTFTALEEDTPYVFYVSAETSAGEGMAAMTMATTMEDGMWLHLLAFASCCPGKVRCV